jgi:hypothetical protein
MTAPAEGNAHPDVVELSDLTEDLLAPERAAAVRAHVSSCAQCGEVLASLQGVRALLGEAPPAEPMPADIAARIDAALLAEERDATDLPDEPSGVPRETSPRTVDRPHADVPRGTSAPAGRPTAPTGPGRSRRRSRGLRFAVAASSAAVLALGWMTYQLAQQHTGSGTMSADSSAKRSDAQAPAAAGMVGDQVARLLGGTGSAESGSGSGKSGANSPMLDPRGGTAVTAPDGTVTAVPACVLQATMRAQKPLAAERESYQGVDSYLVVLPDPADSTYVDAFVVTAACSAADPGRVLFQNSYPRR